MRAFSQQPQNQLDIFLPFQFPRKCGAWSLILDLWFWNQLLILHSNFGQVFEDLISWMANGFKLAYRKCQCFFTLHSFFLMSAQSDAYQTTWFGVVKLSHTTHPPFVSSSWLMNEIACFSTWFSRHGHSWKEQKQIITMLHTWTERRLNPTWVYLGSKGTRRTPSTRALKWAPNWYVSRLAPRFL